MKKSVLAFVLALAAAVGLRADTVALVTTSHSFGTGNPDSTGTTLDVTKADAAGNTLWSLAGTDVEAPEIVTSDTAVNPYSGSVNVRRTFTDGDNTAEANTHYLALDMASGEYLNRGFAASSGTIDATRVYVDTLAQLIGAEEDQTTAVSGTDAQISVWMLAKPSDETTDPVTDGETNLYVTCGLYADAAYAAHSYPLTVSGVTLKNADWCRVTVKSLGNVFATGDARNGFVVFVNGVIASSGTEDSLANVTKSNLTPLAQKYAASNQLFLSLKSTLPLAYASFTGAGSLDDLTIDNVGPGFSNNYLFQVGDVQYETLEDALATESGDILLLQDMSFADFSFAAGRTFDLNGKTLTLTGTAVLGTATIKNTTPATGGLVLNGTLTVASNNDLSGLAWNTTGGFLPQAGAKINIATGIILTMSVTPTQMETDCTGILSGCVNGSKIKVGDVVYKYDGEKWKSGSFRIEIVSAGITAEETETALVFTATEKPLVYVAGVDKTSELVAGDGTWSLTKPEITVDTLVTVMKKVTIAAVGKKWYENPAVKGWATAGDTDGSGTSCPLGQSDLTSGFLAGTFGFTSEPFILSHVEDLLSGAESPVAARYTLPRDNAMRGGAILARWNAFIVGTANIAKGLRVWKLNGTSADYVTVTLKDSSGNTIGPDAIVFTTDGLHFWCNNYVGTAANTGLYKFNIPADGFSDGLILTAVDSISIPVKVRGLHLCTYNEVERLYVRCENALYVVPTGTKVVGDPVKTTTDDSIRYSFMCFANSHLYYFDRATGIVSMYNMDGDTGWISGTSLKDVNFWNKGFMKNNSNNGTIAVTEDEETLICCATVPQRYNGDTWQQRVQAIQYVPFAVNVADSEHGTVTASPTTADEGTTVTLTVAADDHYRIDGMPVVMNGDTPVAVTEVTKGTTYTFTMPAASVTVTTTFRSKVLTISIVNAGSKGTVNITGGQTEVEEGNSFTFTVDDVATGFAPYVYFNNTKLTPVEGLYTATCAAEAGAANLGISYVKDTAWYVDAFVKNVYCSGKRSSSGTQFAAMGEEETKLLISYGPSSADCRIGGYDVDTLINSFGEKVEDEIYADGTTGDMWTRVFGMSDKYHCIISCNRGGTAGKVEMRHTLSKTEYTELTLANGGENLIIYPVAMNKGATYFYGTDGSKIYQFSVLNDGTSITGLSLTKSWNVAWRASGLTVATIGGKDIVYGAGNNSEGSNGNLLLIDTTLSDTAEANAVKYIGNNVGGTTEPFSMFVTGLADGAPHLAVCDATVINVYGLSTDGTDVVSTTPLESVSLDLVFAATGYSARNGTVGFDDESKIISAVEFKPSSPSLRISVVEHKPANLIVRMNDGATTNDTLVAFGEAANVVYNAPAGKKITSVTTNGCAVAGASGTSYTFTDAALTSYVHAKITAKYTITANTPSYGTVAVDKDCADAGETVTITLTPESAKCSLKSLVVKQGETDVPVTTVTAGTTYTFTMPAGAVTVTATFKKLQPTMFIIKAKAE